ncbi:MAG TPA: nucleotide exchange factor GrpE [Candidatus Eremiobacteraceae bacterium]|jgi:molecular chaperone GrpE
MAETNPYDEFDSLSGAPMPGIDDAPGDDGKRDEELAALRKQADDQRALYLRALADFDNYKRRNERDSQTRSDAGRREVLKKLLPALDSLQRALQFRTRGTPPEQIVDGLLAMVKQFEAVLESENVRAIETLGKPFDPAISEAVGTASDGSVPDSTVLDEARRGYRIGDDVLRPAQVIVSKRD